MNINDRELRRGSVIQDLELNIIIVHEIFDDSTGWVNVCNENGDRYDIAEDCKPVDISEDLLLTNLFEYSYGGALTIELPCGNFLRIKESKLYVGHSEKWLELKDIQYLHQLQDVYLWFTGRELEVTV